jgi:RNA polymerase sigma-54 factor
MRPALTLRLGQHLALTPQLQQALRLLAMPAAELELELRAALDQNPMLVERDDGSESAEAPLDARTPSADTDHDVALEAFDDETPFAGQERSSSDATVDADWDSAEPAGRQAGGGERGPFETGQAVELDLRGHLIEQLDECRFSEHDLELALALLDGLDDNGWLAEPVATLAAELGVEPAELEAVRHRLQHLDPVGACSTGLADCLAVQLGRFEPATPGLAAARRLVAEHLAALAQPRTAALARALGVDEDEVAAALHLIRTLHPRPAALLGTGAAEYVVPDAVVRRREGRWVVELNLGPLPQLQVNEAYAAALGRGGDAPLRAQLTEARWLVKSLAMRNATLLAVARALVQRQVGFLERGPEAMRPLLARELAEELGLHESTISRVTAGKWLLTPRGNFPFRHFFSTQLERDDGGDVSATAVRAMIERLVGAEDQRRPLSDNDLTKALAAQGIRVARRTVTKYREALAIPASYERRALQ